SSCSMTRCVKSRWPENPSASVPCRRTWREVTAKPFFLRAGKSVVELGPVWIESDAIGPTPGTEDVRVMAVGRLTHASEFSQISLNLGEERVGGVEVALQPGELLPGAIALVLIVERHRQLEAGLGIAGMGVHQAGVLVGCELEAVLREVQVAQVVVGLQKL